VTPPGLTPAELTPPELTLESDAEDEITARRLRAAGNGE
jgi:hypothetical protein